jgi:hypothetical protein
VNRSTTCRSGDLPYEGTKPPIPKHSFNEKCLLCFSDLPKTEFRYDDPYICDECAINMIGENLDDKWHAMCQGCKNKAEVVAKLQTDVLFRDDFNKFRNQILKIQATGRH